LNAFTFNGKTILHFAFLILAISAAIFTFVTTIVCWRTTIPRRKWLWRFFVLFGCGSLTLNWTTGAIQYQVLQIVLFAAGFMKPFYGPLALQISLPIGAIIFWVQRGTWLKAKTDPVGSTDT
jgi:phosphoglycerol transferase MdoB-like AlkP superfamily enzyme